MDPVRKELMNTFCDITKDGADMGYKQGRYTVRWQHLCNLGLAKNGEQSALEKAKIRWYRNVLMQPFTFFMHA